MARNSKRPMELGAKRHALFFFLIYIVGALLLTFEKTFIYTFFSSESGLAKAIIIATAMLLMGIYVFFVTLVPATKLRTDVAADNVYYLGFLFTLTSLAIALSIDSADAILANFGVAIISTLIGIAARVGLNQLRVDPTDIEEASRLELSGATSRVKAELNETVRQLTEFRQISLQVMSEGYADVQKNVETISTQVLQSLEELVKQSAKPLEEVAERTRVANTEAVKSIDDFTKSSKALTKSHKEMSAQIEQVNNALTSLSQHYSDTGIIDDKVIGAVQEQLSNVQDQLTKKAQDELGELKNALDDNNRNSEELRNELNQILSNASAENNTSDSQKPDVSDKVAAATEADAKSPTFGNYKEELNIGEAPETYWYEKISYNSDKKVFSVGENNFSTLDAAKKYIQSKSISNIQRKS
ncbi:hypothetical protein N9X02_03845 [Planktomarina temperata]|nr:hypothetical protein [Planktomarina temperata]